MTLHMKIVSACLAGIPCRYDAKAKPRLDLIEMVEKGEAIALCPEELGGLGTPRPPSERIGDKVFTIGGDDVTAQFFKGAHLALEKAQSAGANHAILKSCSPMCGVGRIYDGSFNGSLKEGDGMFTEILRNADITVEERD